MKWCLVDLVGARECEAACAGCGNPHGTRQGGGPTIRPLPGTPALSLVGNCLYDCFWILFAASLTELQPWRAVERAAGSRLALQMLVNEQAPPAAAPVLLLGLLPCPPPLLCYGKTVPSPPLHSVPGKAQHSFKGLPALAGVEQGPEEHQLPALPCPCDAGEGDVYHVYSVSTWPRGYFLKHCDICFTSA